MATKSAVAVGILPTADTGTVDLTVSGFGTVSAAIVIVSNANTTNNPQTAASLCIGFWDGVNSTQKSIYTASVDNAATSQTGYYQDSTHAIRIGTDSAGSESLQTLATASAITDGIRITKNSGTTGVQRYVTAILIGGASNVYLGSQNLGTGTSELNIETPGFKPTVVFCLTAAGGTENSYQQLGRMGFGVAHNNSSNSVSQGFIAWSSVDALTAAQQSGCYITNTYCLGQYSTDSFSYSVTASNFDSLGFSLTPSANAGSDIIYYLAVALPDHDDAWLGVIDAKQSTGTQAYTGTGFTPQAVGLVGSMASALDTHTNSGTLTFGATDGTTQQALGIVDDDAAATSNTEAYANTSNVYYLRQDGPSDEAIAAYSSFDSNGFTLSFSDGASAARKILAFAIGDSAGGGGATGTLAATEAGSDTASIAGDVLIDGAFAVTESGSDTAALTGDVLVQGALAVTETGNDTAAATGLVLVQGTLSATESGADTAAFTGDASSAVVGSIGATETGSDTAAVTGLVLIQGGLTATESGSDTASVTCLVLIQGGLSATESGSDTALISGTSAIIGTGTLAAVEGGTDTAAIGGVVRISGAIAAAESSSDTASLAGVVPISGMLEATEAGSDTADISSFRPTVPGIEYTLPQGKAHYTLPDGRAHFTIAA